MSYLDRYKRRMQASAGRSSEQIDETGSITLQEAQLTRATDSQVRSFYNSPTLEKVQYKLVSQPPETVSTIKSDKYKDIEIQTFLFEPLKDIQIGTLIKTNEYTYLAFAKNGEKIFPELVAKLCNDEFEIPMGTKTEITYDRFDNPIYTEVPIAPEVAPAVISDKDYSTSDNSILPLPSGRINIELQYKPEYLEYFNINLRFKHSGGDYRVTDIRVVNYTPTEKYIKVSATRVVEEA